MVMDTIPKVHRDYDKIDLFTSVGFSEIPEQVRELSIKEGFHLNLLVVSRRGLGASTLINSLFSAPIMKKDRQDTITTTVNEIVENGIKLTISVTSYHGEDLNKVYKYINALNEEYFEMEQGLSVQFPDKRIHCCLYLIPGDKISEHEIQGLKDLTLKLNVVPVITKADMFTDEELKCHREKNNKIFEENQISFYDYEENNTKNFPLAVIASESVYDEDGFKTRGRKYAWGFIDIENEKFSDFKKLQRILISERFVDLIYKTDMMFYNAVRKSLIKEETTSNSKKQLFKLLCQMEAAVDEKYTEKLKKLDEEKIIHSDKFNENISVKTGQLTVTTE
ncbi:Septin-4 [Glugoides intestinalis]